MNAYSILHIIYSFTTKLQYTIYVTAHVHTVLKIAKKTVDQQVENTEAVRHTKPSCSFLLCRDTVRGRTSLTRSLIREISFVFLCFVSIAFAVLVTLRKSESGAGQVSVWLGGTPGYGLHEVHTFKKGGGEEIYQRIVSILCTFLSNFLITFANTNFDFKLYNSK